MNKENMLKVADSIEFGRIGFDMRIVFNEEEMTGCVAGHSAILFDENFENVDIEDHDYINQGLNYLGLSEEDSVELFIATSLDKKPYPDGAQKDEHNHWCDNYSGANVLYWAYSNLDAAKAIRWMVANDTVNWKIALEATK